MGKTANIQKAIASQGAAQGKVAGAVSSKASSILKKERAYAAQVREMILGEMSYEAITKRWDETFAQPAMEAWWKYNAPGVRDEFAGIPGAFFSADKARGVVQQSNMYSGQIAQTLYGSLEAAAARNPQYMQMYSNLSPARVFAGWLDAMTGGLKPIQTYPDEKRAARKRMQGEWWGAAAGAVGSLVGGIGGGAAGSKIGSTYGGGGYNLGAGSSGGKAMDYSGGR